MDRWVIPAIAAIAALAIGFGIGAAVYGDDDPDVATPETETAEATPTPAADAEGQQTCLAALEAAEQEVQAEERTSTLLDDYESVINRATEALADFDTRRLEQLLTEVEELNRRSDRLIEESRDADISSAIDTCQSVLGTDV